VWLGIFKSSQVFSISTVPPHFKLANQKSYFAPQFSTFAALLYNYLLEI